MCVFVCGRAAVRQRREYDAVVEQRDGSRVQATGSVHHRPVLQVQAGRRGSVRERTHDSGREHRRQRGTQAVVPSKSSS